MKKIFLIFFITIQANLFSQSKFLSDFQSYKSIMETTHPYLYRFTPKEVFTSKFDSIEKILTEDSLVSELQFFRMLSELHSMIREGHNDIEVPKNLQKVANTKNIFPFNVWLLDSSLVVRKSRVDNSNYKFFEGAEILSINGKSIKKIIKEFEYKTCEKSAFNISGIKDIMSVSTNFAFAYFYFIDTTSKFNVVYEKNGIVGNAEIVGSNLHLENSKYPIRRKENKNPLKLIIDKENDLAIIKITTFANWIVNIKYKEYEEFYKQSFEKIKENDISNLVIDLRYNRGGNELLGAELLTYIYNKPFVIYSELRTKTLDYSILKTINKRKIKLQKKEFEEKESFFVVKDNNYLLDTLYPKVDRFFNGNIFFFSNNSCYSTANTVLALVKTNSMGVIVGQESGGSFQYVDGRIALNFVLPISKIKVNYRAFSMKIASSNFDIKRGVVPDIHIYYTKKDLLEGKDLELEYIKNKLNFEK